MKLLFATLALFTSTAAFAAIDCPRFYPNGSLLAYGDGSIRYQDGNTFRYSDGSFRFPNGNLFRYTDGSFHYQNGNVLRYSDGTYRYANGATARSTDGTLRDATGNVVSTGMITISDSFGDGKLKVTVRQRAVRYQMSLPYGATSMDVSVSEAGDVECDIPTDLNPRLFKIDGAAGSAIIELKTGHNETDVKAAVQKALDAN